jgi:hypothetical protein
MIDASIIPLKEHFSSLDHPRAQHRIEHLLLDIVLVNAIAPWVKAHAEISEAIDKSGASPICAVCILNSANWYNV